MDNIDLHIYPSNIKHETRILKETKSIVDSGLFDKVFIAGIWESGLKEREDLDDKRVVWRFPLKTQCLPNHSFWKVLKHIEWTGRVFVRFKKQDITLVNCHSLSVLPLGVLFKAFLGSKIVYDTHELETETCAMSRTRKILSKLLERLLIYHVESVLVVSDSIARWYRNHYDLKEVNVIKNVPYGKHSRREHSNILKERFSIQDDEILFIYQGILGRSRGIEFLLNVFSNVDKKRHVVFMGFGDLENMVKQYENRFSNIHFHPAVKPEEIVKYTSSADIGVHLPENNCLSYFYSLPNKFFEYLLSGLPVIVGDFPEMGKIIDNYKCGWKVPVDQTSVLNLIEDITIRDIERKKNIVFNCKDEFSWEKEEKELLRVYHKLMSGIERF